MTTGAERDIENQAINSKEHSLGAGPVVAWKKGVLLYSLNLCHYVYVQAVLPRGCSGTSSSGILYLLDACFCNLSNVLLSVEFGFS